MPITFACPVCKASYTVEALDAGKKGACRKCGQRLQVPKPPQRLKTVLGKIEEDSPQQDQSPITESPVWELPSATPTEPARESVAAPEPSQERYESPYDPGSTSEDDDYPPNRHGGRRSTEHEYQASDRSSRRPGKAQAIAFMILLGGAWAILWALAGIVLSGCTCFFWPGTYYDIVFGILAIIRGAELMSAGRGARRSPRTILIMQIITIVNLDFANLACGIVGFVFLNDPAVERFYSQGDRET